MKFIYIDFSRHNPWGTCDRATHYYVDGKRVKGSRIGSYESYAHEHYRYDHTECKTVVKDGITRDYTIIYYTEKN